MLLEEQKASLVPAPDEYRRAQLRAFLVESRARLGPADVGLPETTSRRRVAGLRREEVAELVGVSSDWYRWFESGRPIRVSGPFLAKLAAALRLSTLERRTLYSLAFPELFGTDQAYRAVSHQMPLLSPVQSLDEVESVVRMLAEARERFLTGGDNLKDVRPRVLSSWARSVRLGVDAAGQTVPYLARSDEEISAARLLSDRLLRAAEPTLSALDTLLTDSGYSIVMTNGAGCILDMRADRANLSALSRINFQPGGDLSESGCGTNAVGTAIADRRPIQVVGAENFLQGGSDLTCTAAPIEDPKTSEIIGVLDVTANYRRIHPEILSVVVQAALEIEERLASVVSTHA